jgi:hypothetical protein
MIKTLIITIKIILISHLKKDKLLIFSITKNNKSFINKRIEKNLKKKKNNNIINKILDLNKWKLYFFLLKLNEKFEKSVVFKNLKNYMS